MNQSQQYQPPRRQGTYSSSHSSHNDELHISGMSHPGQMSPREYASTGAPHIKLEQVPGNAPSMQGYQSSSAVPNVLQPGGLGGRPSAVSANTAPVVPTLQQQHQQQHQQQQQQSQQSPQQQQQHSQHQQLPASDYQTSQKPTSLGLAHTYSRSSPATASAYDSAAHYVPYSPDTPGGAGSSSSQYISPTDSKYGGGGGGGSSSSAGGLQRNMSTTPLGLADIRPRADSNLSDGMMPGTLQYELANTQPGTSNYMAPWALYAFDWCKWQPQGSSAGKLALGSYLEDGHNFIQIVDAQLTSTPPDVYSPGGSKYSLEFTKIAEATHSYPITRLLWEPPSTQKQSTDLLATSGDHLRLWSLPNDPSMASASSAITGSRGGSSRGDMPVTKLTPLALLSNSKTPDHTAPLTSLDWNTVTPSLIITSSIDTTCTIWDIPSLTAKTQLIAHDKEVYDVRFCANSTDVFVSCGQDGSVRMFDLRSLEHSTIIYEPTGKDERDPNGSRVSPTLAQQTMSHPPPLLRLATSPHDQHLLATFAQDSSVVRILDVRQPGQALLELRGHSGALNCVEWSPLRRGTLASGGDDCQVLIWDLINSSSSSSVGAIGMNGASSASSGGGSAAVGSSSVSGSSSAGQGAGAEGNAANVRSPVASWQCEYEVGNLGWVPRLANGDYGEWLGVTAGRGVWGVRL